MKLSNATRTWWQRRGKDVLKGLDMLDQHNLLITLPTYLGADLYDWLFEQENGENRKNRRLIVLCDTYEALWRDQPTKTGLEAMRVDAWVRKWVEEAPGVLFVLLGRDKLGWAELDADWALVIDSHLLDALSKEDAEQFLRQIPIVEDDIRAAIIDAAEGLPFYLDLQVDHYENLKQTNSSPAVQLFGGKHQEILARFIDHLDEPSRRALQIISHARFVDVSLTLQLAEKFLGGKASIHFKQLMDFSFWRQDGETWHLHSLMHDYLQDRQREHEPELFTAIHQYLFEQYENKLTALKQVSDITENHRLALVEAGYHLQQCDVDRFLSWTHERYRIFSDDYAWEQLTPLCERAKEIAESLLLKTTGTAEHVNVATALNNLAELYKSQGRYEAAEPLYQRSLKIWEEKLGADHPDVATSLNNLAGLYQSQGRYEAAEPLYQRSLKIREEKLGADHPDVATSLNNLAALYQSQGRGEDAELLYQRIKQPPNR